jgi:hypothetical protein
MSDGVALGVWFDTSIVLAFAVILGSADESW